ncbi:MAG: trehalose-6-phosphate synthase, partial [Gallionella sp.]
MRLSLRFVLPLMLVLAGIAYAVTPLVDQLTLSWFVRDLDSRSSLIANTIQEPLQELLAADQKARIVGFFNRITQDERLYAIGYCASPTGKILASRSLPADITCAEFDHWKIPDDNLLQSAKGPLHVTVRPMTSEATPAGRLVLLHDTSFVNRRSAETKLYIFYLFMGLAVVISLITVIIAQLSWRGWMAGMRSLLRGEGLLRQPGAGTQSNLPEFKPIARDLQRLIRELESDAHARDEDQITWTSESLRTILH